VLQHHYASVEAMALDRDTVEEVSDFTRTSVLLQQYVDVSEESKLNWRNDQHAVLSALASYKWQAVRLSHTVSHYPVQIRSILWCKII